MIIHGGVRDAVLNDWNLFDFGLATWISLKVLDEKGKPFSIYRKHHTITPTSSIGIEPLK